MWVSVWSQYAVTGSGHMTRYSFTIDAFLNQKQVRNFYLHEIDLLSAGTSEYECPYTLEDDSSSQAPHQQSHAASLV